MTDTLIQGFRLSPQQARLWAMQQQDPDTPLAARCVVRLRGEVSVSALRAALAAVAGRHEMLRTSFQTLPGAGLPVQVVADQAEPALEVRDLTALPAAARAEVEEEADLARTDPAGSPLSAVLFHRGQGEHALHLALPALWADAATLDNLAAETMAAYAASVDGGSVEDALGEAVQFVDYSEWVHEMLAAEDTAPGREFWSRVALPDHAPEGLLAPTADDAAEPRPAGSTHHAALPASDTVALETAAEEAGVSVEAWLLAAWTALLARHGRGPAPAVAVRLEGRSFDEFRGSLGPFARYAPLAFAAEPGTAFRALVTAVDATLAEARAWQDSFAAPAAVRARYGFDFRAADALSGDAGGVRWQVERAWQRTEPFALRLSVERSGEAFDATLHAAGIAHGSADRLLRRFAALLRASVESPDAPVESLGLLDGAEEDEVLRAWSAAPDAPAGAPHAHRAFAARAAATPNAVALSFEGGEVTFAELERRASRIANLLRAWGVGAESRVGLLLERSPEMVAAILGTLKAGAAYVPLDPAYPAERLAFVAGDAGLSMVVAHAVTAGQMPDAGVPVLDLDAASTDLAAQPEDAPSVEADGRKAAYVIYTSGSTGAPKGVVVEHRSLAVQLAWMLRRYPLGADDVVLQKTPFHFDASVWEILAPLAAGARLHLAPPGAHADGAYLARAVADYGITTLQVVPSQVRLAQAAGGVVGWTGLRRLFSGGEALGETLRDALHAELPGTALVNLYGPTETTVQCAAWRVAPGERGPVPVGRPVDGARLHVLDAAMRPVPAGVAGELFVGGAGVARGYLRRPAMTAGRFVPDPFAAEPGARLYRTGDLARWRADGALEYLGRTDGQVKLRGYRVEPGEVEAVLEAHPAVRACAVVVRGGDDEMRLVAFWTRAAGAGEGADDLRRHLRDRLPHYMVPAALVELDALPSLPSGKVDRRALPEVETAAAEAPYEAPANALEEALCLVWADVLGAERVGVHDNFFALGGDSILSVRVVAMARDRGVRVAIQDLFQHQTVRELARAVAAQGAGGVDEAGVVLREDRAPFDLLRPEDRAALPADAEDAYPLSYLQAGMLYQMELDPGTPAYHNVNSYQFRGPFDADAFRAAVQRSVDLHPNLRTSIHLRGFAEPLQVVHRQVTFHVGVDDLRGMDAVEQRRALDAFREHEFATLFDLAQAPLMRLHAHRLADDRFQLTLTECHAIADGWSTTSLFGDVFVDYAALLRGEPMPERPEPQVRFRDFVELERATVASEASRGFWRERLAGLVPGRLPRLPGSEGVAGRARPAHVPVPPELNDALRALTRAWAVPVKSLLLAAHLKTLSLLSGEEDVVTGVTVNGRPELAGGTEVRGLFLNTVPFRVRVAGGTWRELVRETFRTEMEIIPHRRYPLALLQREHGPERLFETNFTLVHFHSVADMVNEGVVRALENTDLAETSFPYDTTVVLDPTTSDIVSVRVAHKPDVLTTEQAAWLGERFRMVLQAMAAHPDAPHAAADLLPAGERERVLDAFAGQRGPAPADTVHGLFRTQAERTPAATALVFGAERLTYAELSARANRLAHHLRRLGVGPESRVGICLDRGVEMIVSVLAVLKAGGAYVPLDPNYPPDRLRYMLDDSGARVLVTTSRLAEGAAGLGIPTVRVDADSDVLAGLPSADPVETASPESAAYVVYTSGTTGRPKGVVVEHRSLANAYRGWEEAYGLRCSTTHLQMASFSFDVFGGDLVRALCSGGTLVLCPFETLLAPEELYALMTGTGVDSAEFVPAVLRGLVAHLERTGQRLDFMRLLVAGSDVWYGREYEQILALSGSGTRCINSYGVAEAAVDSTYFQGAAGQLAPGAVVPIGRPFPGTRVLVLDASMRPAPVGVPGELYVGGANVARGYHGRPAMTAERFVPDPLGEGGERLYRTGDRARWLADGNLEFLGRADHQVKIRGFRIEPGEVEAVLQKHPSVSQALVVVRSDQPGDARLVAYVVAAPGAEVSPAALQAHVREALPVYMVPSAVVALPAFPLSPNGKLDRRALPAPERTRDAAAADFERPQGGLEERIAAVWAEVLGVDRVGVHDNFFDLGGHSLLLLRVYEQLRGEAPELRLVDLLQYPTVRALARRLAGTDAEQAAQEEGEQRGEARAAALDVRRLARQRRGG